MFKKSAILLITIFCFYTAKSQNNKVKHHVVMEITSNDTLAWKGMMNNIEHIIDLWGDSVQVEVVAHGPGIEILVKGKTTQEKRMASFKLKGVLFEACNNSMKARKLAPEDMIPQADIVPSGVGEVILKEEKGWSYLKSGF